LAARSEPLKGKATMLDVILLALGLAFFALSIGYAFACDRL
jgi:SNF family Na+-dependent transporter